jgi:hypothetical protein
MINKLKDLFNHCLSVITFAQKKEDIMVPENFGEIQIPPTPAKPKKKMATPRKKATSKKAK